jgi:hypothetical protein
MQITVQVFAQSDFLQIEGLRSNHQGAARWNADGIGPEPAVTGHTMINGLPATYYFSTIDYDDIDLQSTSGFSFSGTATGFSNFINALTTNGFSSSDVTIKFGLYDLGNDIQGEDWWINGNMETWIFTSQHDILIQVNGEDMVGAPAPPLRAVLDFGTFYWSLEIDTFLVEDRSATSSVAVQAVAAAFLSDVQQPDSGLKLIRPMAPNTNAISFNGNGRTGYTFDTGVWRLEMVPLILASIDNQPRPELPSTFKLHQNYPNPFNPTTTIQYELSGSANVVLKIYNTLGQEVVTLVNGKQPAGTKSVTWDGRDHSGRHVGSGIYVYQMKVENEIQSKKMVLML